MGILLCEQHFWDVWIRNKSVRAEIGQILHTDTHPHTTAAKLVVRMSPVFGVFYMSEIKFPFLIIIKFRSVSDVTPSSSTGLVCSVFRLIGLLMCRRHSKTLARSKQSRAVEVRNRKLLVESDYLLPARIRALAAH